jgi:hypothetical protein
MVVNFSDREVCGTRIGDLYGANIRPDQLSYTLRVFFNGFEWSLMCVDIKNNF